MSYERYVTEEEKDDLMEDVDDLSDVLDEVNKSLFGDTDHFDENFDPEELDFN